MDVLASRMIPDDISNICKCMYYYHVEDLQMDILTIQVLPSTVRSPLNTQAFEAELAPLTEAIVLFSRVTRLSEA
jgi:hypothetical protein